LDQIESVPTVLEVAARGEIADIYSDIRKTLGTSVVNLIWRNLATIPGALRWTWSTLKPLYLGRAPAHAEAVRRALVWPIIPDLSVNALAAMGLGRTPLEEIRRVLDSYHHTNALALVVLSALLELYDPRLAGVVRPSEFVPSQPPTELPTLPSMATLQPEVRRLILELNEFGEDTKPSLIASMYRHLAYWPTYLAIVHTMLAPLAADGRLNALTLRARALGRAHGQVLASQLIPEPPPSSIEDVLGSCRLFVEHPIARMTGICAIIQRATPR
jgi:hypothetical protein